MSNDAGETKIYQVVHDSEEEIKNKEKDRQDRLKSYKRWRLAAVLMALILALCICVAGTGFYIAAKMVSDAPEIDPRDFVYEESSKIYDMNGEVITEVGSYMRENIRYEDCPEALIDSFLAIEDSRFFTHFGFDIPRFTKAIIENLRTMSFGQGGSTFTIQLIKNTYFVDEDGDSVQEGRGIPYKVQQIFLAIQLEKMIDKKEIFELYMNRLNFGGKIRGVQKAAEYYFGKSCQELNLSEAALLAGIINQPNGFNPYYFLDSATARRNDVIYYLYEHGYITMHEAELAASINVEDQLAGTFFHASESRCQAYVDAVFEEAQAMTGYDPTVRGMRIYTYMSPTVQQKIEDIQNGETEVQFPDDLMQVAIIAMNNRNGAIVGIGGGRNYTGSRLLNRATRNFKQPGSSVKPVLSYALAFEYLGYSLDEVLLDKPITYPYEKMVLHNASGNYSGDVTIMDAVALSLNIPAILTLQRVEETVGKETIVAYMQSVGFSRVTNENFHLSFAIGGTWFETTVKELAGAHAAMINHGVYNEPHTIQKIVMMDGTEYYPQNQNRQVLSPGSAWLTCQLMRNNVEGRFMNLMQLLKRSYPIYAKTGTSDWGRDGLPYGIPQGAMKDKWMVASSSNYTNAVWCGYDMAVKGEGTYFTVYKQNLNIPGVINKLLLDAEEEIMTELPEAVPMPDDVVSSTYVYGSWPHVQPEGWMNSGAYITSQVSKAGLTNMPLYSSEEYREYLKAHQDTNGGISASYDQYSTLTVSWGTTNGTCSGGTRNISLHDGTNDIDEWGTCLVDLGWLAGTGGSYWATVYQDGWETASVYSDNGYFKGWVTDLWGEVKVCGASSGGQTACAVAKYAPIDEGGWWDENGNWVPNP
ncbi:MAG: transglycosylase domain-containing protein [Solobacterium sp.]|nr:transglycosylase domain-containing protein [Solobacterium sp.]